MPIIKSAKKRVKVAQKAAVRNAKTKRNMREALKTFSKALEGGKSADISKAQIAAISALDQAVNKAVIHKNKAGRKKAQIAFQAKAKGVKIAKTATKTLVKKTSAKTAKATAKKTSVKKAAK